MAAVKVLPAEVARKIAAGEVIDRPASIVRELMDNAVDSGADTITVEIEGGGIEKIRVIDNGSGMTKEDLLVCATPHATSKISHEADLLSLSTLGFRGEALSSIAAVARLSVHSGTWLMETDILHPRSVTACQPADGTIVEAAGLFENFPARRVFLKRPSSEAALCRQTFLEKAIARTDISFRLYIDGSLRCDLPAAATLSERFAQAQRIEAQRQLLYELKAENPAGNPAKWSFTLVIGEPSLFRNDRKDISIYVNGRKLQEFSLVQAIEFGCSGFFPNGTHPVAALFAQVAPETVDFNIHPAKREARFKDLSGLHHGVSTVTANFFRNYGIKKTADSALHEKEDARPSPAPDLGLLAEQALPKDEPPEFSSLSYFSPHKVASRRSYGSRSGYNGEYPAYSAPARDSVGLRSVAEQAPPAYTADFAAESGFRFIGCALGTFLIAEKDGTLYFIDQHAAHERLRFDKIIARSGQRQPLLVPYVLRTDSAAQDAYLRSLQAELEKAGYVIEESGGGTWEVSAVPQLWHGSQEDLQRDLLESQLEPQQLVRSMAASAACRGAVMAGDPLDSATAAQLAKDALSLPDPHCPHGRPVWTTLSRAQLFSLVRRT